MPGAYGITVTAPGFSSASSDASVLVSDVRDLTLTLPPAGVREIVNVKGQASSITTQPVDTASAVQKATVTFHDLDTIPLAARSFANI